jgi:hypothetical protein
MEQQPPPTEARGSSGRANAPSGSLAIPICTPSQVNLGEESRGDQFCLAGRSGGFFAGFGQLSEGRLGALVCVFTTLGLLG